MKRFLLVILTAAVFAGSFAGCKKHVSNKPAMAYTRSYVMAFYEPQGIKLRALPPAELSDNDCAVIHVDLIRAATVATYKSTGAEKETYDQLSAKYNDMEFKRVIHLPVDGRVIEFPNVDFTAIDIKSDADFNSTHLAGASLNDMVSVELNSAMPYVASDYSAYDRQEGAFVWSHITKDPMNTLTADDLRLLGTGHIGHYECDKVGCGCGTCADAGTGQHKVVHDLDHIAHITFNEEPTMAKTHNFTVTLTADGGKKYSAEIELTCE